MSGWLVGVDTGGTFTDLIAVEPGTGEFRRAKVPSVPDDPSIAVLDALKKLFAEGIAPPTSRSSCTAPRLPPMRCLKAKAPAPGS